MTQTTTTTDPVLKIQFDGRVKRFRSKVTGRFCSAAAFAVAEKEFKAELLAVAEAEMPSFEIDAMRTTTLDLPGAAIDRWNARRRRYAKIGNPNQAWDDDSAQRRLRVA